MDYSEYQVHDFASDNFFIAWVLDGSAEARLFWEDYMRKNPAQRDTIERARELLIDLRKSEQTLHTAARVNKMWHHIEKGIAGTRSRTYREKSFWLFKVAASISILVLMVIGWYRFGAVEMVNKAVATTAASAGDEAFLEEVNNTGRTIQIHLSDGSTVRLYDNSRLRYRKDHGTHKFREVYLTGEAFFTVAKDAAHPFLVYTQDVVTKVLGTSFRVKAFDTDDDVLVAVKEGKVSVYPASEGDIHIDSLVSERSGVVLTPNQQVRYTRAENSFVKTLIADPQIVDDHRAVAPYFAFENMPVTEVFEMFEQAYGVEIIVNEEVMRNCFLTVRLGDEPLFDKLRIVCRTIDARYELIDAKIVIEGKGCGGM